MTKKPTQELAERLSIKGTEEGLVVSIGEGEWSELMDGLTGHLQHEAAFFSGAQTIVDAGPRALTPADLRSLKEILSAHRMEICGIRTAVPETEAAACELKIPIQVPVNAASRLAAPLHPNQKDVEALFVKRTLRSGQMVQYPGHVIIVGDVNPGAEVVASGDIVVWGKLRGTAHAGAQGDESAVVCSLFLAPTQLRIGHQIARSPEGDERDLVIPEVARVGERGIMVEPWTVPDK